MAEDKMQPRRFRARLPRALQTAQPAGKHLLGNPAVLESTGPNMAHLTPSLGRAGWHASSTNVDRAEWMDRA